MWRYQFKAGHMLMERNCSVMGFIHTGRVRMMGGDSWRVKSKFICLVGVVMILREYCRQQIEFFFEKNMWIRCKSNGTIIII